MFTKIMANPQILCFLGGILSATVGKKLLMHENSRKLCVKGVAYGMRLQKDALETIQNIKEEAQDICLDAEKTNTTSSTKKDK